MFAVLRELFSWLLSKLQGPPIERTRDEMILILEQELAGTVDRDVWDEFVCVAVADPELEAIRERIPMEGAVTEEGRAAVEKGLQTLRALKPTAGD